MKLFFLNVLRTVVAIPLITIATLICYFAYNIPFLLSLIFSIVGVSLTYGLVSIGMNFYTVKKHNLTIREYLFIKKNLYEANKKMKRLYKSLFSIHHLPSLKQRIKLIRLMRKIFKITSKHPDRFYKADGFFFRNLDSVVQLMEKFVFLSGQPGRNPELLITLSEAERTLRQLTNSIEEDLHKVIADDIDDLNFEIDLANYSNKNYFSRK